MSARDRILNKLKAAPRQDKAVPDVAAWYATHRAPEDKAGKVQRFRQCIELAHAEVHAVTPADWLTTLREVLRSKGLDKILVSEETTHGCAVLDEFPRQGVDCQVYDMAIEAWKTEMFNATPASLPAAPWTPGTDFRMPSAAPSPMLPPKPMNTLDGDWMPSRLVNFDLRPEAKSPIAVTAPPMADLMPLVSPLMMFVPKSVKFFGRSTPNQDSTPENAL